MSCRESEGDVSYERVSYIEAAICDYVHSSNEALAAKGVLDIVQVRVLD